jgi:hypothetical protein
VLAAGVKTESKNDKPLAVQSVTLLVKPKGAEDLALALHEGKLQSRAAESCRFASWRTCVPRRLRTSRAMGEARPQVARAPKPAPSKPVVMAPAPPPPVAVKPAPDPTYTIIRDGKIQEQESPTEKNRGEPKSSSGPEQLPPSPKRMVMHLSPPSFARAAWCRTVLVVLPLRSRSSRRHALRTPRSVSPSANR